VLDSRRRGLRRTIFDLLVLLTRASSITMFVVLARPRPLRRNNLSPEPQAQRLTPRRQVGSTTSQSRLKTLPITQSQILDGSPQMYG
jgi:hypothetical protein